MVLFQIQRHVRPSKGSVEEKAVFLCLLLEPTSQGISVDYRRVGIAEAPDTNGLDRSGWEKREIVIV